MDSTSSATEIQSLALEVFNNKTSYKDNDYIVIMNILKESYMRVKGLLNDFQNEKEEEPEPVVEEVKEEPTVYKNLSEVYEKNKPKQNNKKNKNKKSSKKKSK